MSILRVGSSAPSYSSFLIVPSSVSVVNREGRAKQNRGRLSSGLGTQRNAVLHPRCQVPAAGRASPQPSR